MKISREDEAKFPSFSSHEEAKNFFEEKYGDYFIVTGTELINGERIFFYALLLEPKIYYDGMKKLEKGVPVTGLDLMNSYQPIEIFEDGRVHIVH